MSEIKEGSTVMTPKDQRAEMLLKGEEAGFTALRGGLGLADGRYVLTTPDHENIYGIRYVSRRSDGQKFQLTCIAGVVSNGKISKTFGLGAKDTPLVISVQFWEQIEPNQKYNIAIVNGRVSTMELVSADVLEDQEA